MNDRLARSAASLWGMENSEISLVSRHKNVVYRIRHDGADYALRLHRPRARSVEMLASERQWLAALSAHGLSVPTPIASKHARLIETVAGTSVDLSVWVEGRPFAGGGQPADRQAFCAAAGQTLGALHLHGSNWRRPEGFTLPEWNREGLLGEAPLGGRFWDMPELSHDQRRVFVIARARANQQLERIAHKLDYGLIHGNSGTKNILSAGDNLSMIGFGQCGFGFRELDIAALLLPLHGTPEYNELESTFLAAYELKRARRSQNISLFILLRAMSECGNQLNAPATSDPLRSSEQRITRALALAQSFLSETRAPLR